MTDPEPQRRAARERRLTTDSDRAGAIADHHPPMLRDGWHAAQPDGPPA